MLPVSWGRGGAVVSDFSSCASFAPTARLWGAGLEGIAPASATITAIATRGMLSRKRSGTSGIMAVSEARLKSYP